MTYLPTDRQAILAEIATHGPRHLRAFTGCTDRHAYGRLAVACAKMAGDAVLTWTGPGTYDLGPDAPPWARQLRALTAECAALRARLAEMECV